MHGRPLLALLDDLHWADPDSLGLLGFLCRRLAGASRSVGTTRPWPSDAQDAAAALRSQRGANTYVLAPLGRLAASAVLVDAAGRDVSEDETNAALDACAGNPFLFSHFGLALRSRAGAKLAPRRL